ncbi:MAG: hypothetical protein RR795_01190 [Cetobacterium sp.]|uniref:phage baseplate protein n=1 Tax=Cetobacterium sp. TaxID=2071632 RepID=UPI002FC6C9CE
MATGVINLEVKAGVVTGPPGLSILKTELKEKLPNGDSVYKVIREDNLIIGEFTIPKGEQGIQGILGPKGEDGVGISNITHVKEGLTNKIMISLTNGTSYPVNLLDGENAFELWQNGGNEGDLNDFFEFYRGYGIQYLWRGTELGIKIENQAEYTFTNLIGKTGAQGPQGMQGLQGIQGLQGTKGEQGIQGVKGDKGDIGPQGPPGEVNGDNFFTKNEINDKFKNFCPFPINSILTLLDNSNPAILFHNTTWQKIEGRTILGTSGSETPGTIGGRGTVTLDINNIPVHNHPISISLVPGGNHRHQVDYHLHSKGDQNITGRFAIQKTGYNAENGGATGEGAFYYSTSGWKQGNGANGNGSSPIVGFDAARAWTGNSGGAAPFTNYSDNHGHGIDATIGNTGAGTPFDILPPFIKANIWKRLS